MGRRFVIQAKIFINFLRRDYKAVESLLKEDYLDKTERDLDEIDEVLSSESVRNVVSRAGPPYYLNRIRDFLDSKPRPDGVCRMEPCLSANEHYGLKAQTNIYFRDGENNIFYRDIDFKGIHILKCDLKCVVDYHNQCWKSYKDSEGRKDDKDFLAAGCPTPDCPGVVCGITVIRESGEKTELKNDELVSKVKADKAAEEAASSEAAAAAKAEKASVKRPQPKTVKTGTKKKTLQPSSEQKQPSAQGSLSLNPHARPWLPGSGKDDRSEEGCYPPDIPVRYYTQEQVDDLLMKKEGEVVLYQGQENKLLRQNRADVQRNLDKSRAKVKRQTEEITKLKEQIEAEKDINTELLVANEELIVANERSVLDKHQTLKKVSKEIHTLMHDEVLQFNGLANMVKNRLMPNSRGIDEFTSEQMIMLERINEHLRTLRDIEPSHLFKVQRSYDLSRLVPALEASIENRLRELLLSSGEQRPFGDHSPPPPFPVTPTKEGARPSRGALTDSLPPFGGAAGPSPSGGARAKERPPPPTTSRSVEIGNKLNRFVNQIREVFPNMNDEKVIEHLTRIKSESGAIAKFQVDDIINNIQEHVTRAEQVAKQGSSGRKWDPLPPMRSRLEAAAARAVLDSADDEGNCPICFEYMDPQAMTEELRTMDGCGHVFHATCIKSWFGVKRDCPLCRLHQVPAEDFPSLGAPFGSAQDRANYRRN